MAEYKTNPDLFRALQSAAGVEMTQSEVREQKISFVLGMIDETNDMTRADVAKLIDERDGKAA